MIQAMRWKAVPTLVAASAMAMALLVGGGCAENEGADQAPSDEPQAVPVTATPVEARTLRETVRGVGTLRAKAQVEVRPELAARVLEIGFEEGRRVEQGQLLIRLDASQLEQEAKAREAELSAARSRLTEAESRARRFASLVETNAVSQDEYEAAQSNFEAAQAEVQRLEAELARTRESLEDTVIRAPFAGVISESDVDVGDYVAVGDQLATLYRTDVLEVAFTLPERYMGRVQQGQPVSATVSAYPERPFEGEVVYVSPSIDERTRDFLVKAEVDNGENLLKPGTFATAVVTVDVRENRAVVPEQALVATRQGYIVFVIGEDGQVQQRQVRLGLRQPGLAEIREGVAVGESVVSSGHMNIADGMPVQVAETEPLPGGEGESDLSVAGPTRTVRP